MHELYVTTLAVTTLGGPTVKLKNIAVRNFRGIGPADGTVFPDVDPPLTRIDLIADRIFIVGPNNVGKSSLLWAYDYFVTAKRTATIEDFHGKTETNQILIEVQLQATNDELEDDQTKKWFANNVATVRKVWNAVGKEAVKFTYDPEAQEWVEGGFGGLDTILQHRAPEPIWISGFATPESIIGQLQTLIREAVLEHLSAKEAFQDALKSLDALKDIIEGDQYVSELSNKIAGSIKEFFPDANLTISNPGSEKGLGALFDKQAIVSLSAQNSPTLPFDRHGHGLQRQLVISAMQGAAAELAQLKLSKAARKKADADSVKPRILLIEEPELFLSPPAVRIMKRLLKKVSALDAFQVMAATHSPSMVDLSEEKQTVVRMHRTAAAASYTQIESNFFHIDDRRTVRARTLFNSYFSECIFSDSVIIVEGESELAAIPTIADRFYAEKNCVKLMSSHVVKLSGKDDILLLQRIMRHLRVPYFVIHDLDDASKHTAWNANFDIGNEVAKANKDGVRAYRFAMGRDFERAHGYSCTNKEKLIKAFNHANQLDLEHDVATAPILAVLQSLRDDKPERFNMSNDDICLMDIILRIAGR